MSTGADRAVHPTSYEGVANSNGIQLQYLDWGKDGPPIILIHGLGDNPHAFDDLAAVLCQDFRVIAYARRGHGRSSSTPPYDTATLTSDLLGLLDALSIRSAHFVGWSMGGNEITALAAEHCERVRSIVYLDGGYDYADPAFSAGFSALPASLAETPESATKSFDAYLAHQRRVEYRLLDDMARVEAYLRENVIVQADGNVIPRIDPLTVQNFVQALFSEARRPYSSIKCAALALYAESTFDLHCEDTARRADATVWERQYMVPFREKSKAQIRRELTGVEIIDIAGTHTSFFLTARDTVVRCLRNFLLREKGQLNDE